MPCIYLQREWPARISDCSPRYHVTHITSQCKCGSLVAHQLPSFERRATLVQNIQRPNGLFRRQLAGFVHIQSEEAWAKFLSKEIHAVMQVTGIKRACKIFKIYSRILDSLAIAKKSLR